MNFYLKFMKKYILKILILVILIMAFYIFLFVSNYENSIKLMRADVEIERAKIENAVIIYKDKTGEFPNLYNMENSLSEVISKDGNYNFEMFYGNGKLYEIPSRINKGIKKSNKINPIMDKKGGWFYNIKTGKILPNIEID